MVDAQPKEVFSSAPSEIPLGHARAQSGYIPAIDGFRAVSILIVLTGHFGFGNVIPAAFGVTIFFLISGFLITRLLLKELSDGGRIRFLGFYSRRFVRLAPALLVFITISSVNYSYFSGRGNASQIAAAIFYVINYYNAYVYIHFGFSYPTNVSFVVLWSLAVEEHFYLLFPIIILIAVKAGVGLRTMIALVVAALAWRVVLKLVFHASDEYVHVATDCRFDSILYGCILAYLYNSRKNDSVVLKSFESVWAMFLGLLVLLTTFIIRDALFRETLRYTLQGLGLMVVFSCVLFNNRGWLPIAIKRILSSHPFVFVGKISYSLYLWHYAGICAVNYMFPNLSLYRRLPLLTGFAAVASMLSYTLVERSFIGLRRKLGSHVR